MLAEAAPPGRARRARDHAAGPERQRLSRRGAEARAWGLGRLIRALAEIPDLLRLRYTTSHPRDMDDELIAAHRDVPQLMPFLHLPVQSGSDRGAGGDEPQAHAPTITGASSTGCAPARPDIALSSDFIVGFPGESEADFAATMRLVREIGFAQAYSASNTAASRHARRQGPNRCPRPRKTARLAELQALLARNRPRFNAACVGLDLPVLFTGPGRHPGQIAGRSPYLQAGARPADATLIGAELLVRIDRASPTLCQAISSRSSRRLSHTTTFPVLHSPPRRRPKWQAHAPVPGQYAVAVAPGRSRPASGANRTGTRRPPVLPRQSGRDQRRPAAGRCRAGGARRPCGGVGTR